MAEFWWNKENSIFSYSEEFDRIRKMENMDMNEKEINIVDLLVEILLHWRMFIVWMLVGAVLSGAYGFNRSRNAINSQKMQEEEAQRNPGGGLSKEEIQNVKNLVAYENAYFSKCTYLEESILMQIDPNSISKAEVTITIEAEDYQKSCEIEKVYQNIVQSGELVVNLAEDIGIEATGIDEMIFTDRDLLMLDGLGLVAESSVVNTANTANTMNVVNVLDAGEDSNVLRIVTMDSDEARCKAMLEGIITFLMDKQSNVESTLGKHEIIIANKSFGVVSDSNIAEMQKMALDNIAGMKKVVSNTKDKLSDAERQYYDYLMRDGTEGADESVLPEPATSYISLKYVILGASVSVLLYAMILFIVYIFNSKIRKTDNLQELYDIPQLGLIPIERNCKKFFGFIDEWFLAIQNRNKRQFTREEALELAAVAAKMSAGKEELQEICLIGCGLKERSLDVCEKIKARLTEDKIQVNILNNVLYDAQMMEALEGAKGVLLVESIGSTLYNEITEELEILKRQGIKVLGGILIE